MKMMLTHLVLPEFVLFDGNSHEGDSLEYRTVIYHVRTNTVIEAIAIEDIKEYKLKVDSCQIHEFEYHNSQGVIENHLFVLHFSFAEDSQLADIFAKAESWYKKYLSWEDKSLQEAFSSGFSCN
jgi:hypothetical protein